MLRSDKGFLQYCVGGLSLFTGLLLVIPLIANFIGKLPLVGRFEPNGKFIAWDSVIIRDHGLLVYLIIAVLGGPILMVFGFLLVVYGSRSMKEGG